MNNADLEKAAESHIRERVPIIEFQLPGQAPNLDCLQDMDGPRVMTTLLYHHFYKTELGKVNSKVIVLIRNPKDVLVSFYHFYRMCIVCGYFEGSWGDFFEMFKAKELSFGDWFDHTTSWWNPNKDKSNYIFVRYEDFVRQPNVLVKTLCDFLGKSFDLACIDRLANHTSFQSLAENPRTNMKDIPSYKMSISPFFRKGIVGDWENYFTKEQSDYIDMLYNERCKNAGLILDF